MTKTEQSLNPRLIPALVIVAAIAFLLYAAADHRRDENMSVAGQVKQSAERRAKALQSWSPNETVTGTLLAANFAQAQRDWARANLYLDRLNDPAAGDAATFLRMMLLSLSAGQFDRAADYAGRLEAIEAGSKADNLETVTTAGDGRDLASLVLLVRDVRGGELAAAEKRLTSLKSAALSAFVQPVLINWLRAGQGRTLDAGVDGLSLLQALHRGLAAEWAGQIETANRVFDALARIPLTSSGTMMIAAYNIRQGRIDAARAALKEALRLNPMDLDAKAVMDALNDGQSPVMKPQWSYHLQGVTAGVGMAFMDLAQMMQMDQAADSALIFAQMGRMIRNDVPGLSLLVGNIFEQQERNEDAAAVFSSIQASDIDYVEAQIKLAELRAGEDKPDMAVTILEKLMTQNASPRVAYALGEINRQEQNYKGAIAAYDQVISLSGGKVDDDLWSVYFVRAMAYEELDEWAKAEADLKKALEYRPDNPHVLNFLAYSWADQGINLDEARDMLVRALARLPADPYITDSLGWVYYRQDDIPQATLYMERAVSLRPYDPVLNDHLGDVYAKAGRTLEARYQWQRALDYADKEKDRDLIADVTAKLKKDQAK